MKRSFCAFLLFLSFSAIAGDLYLVCEHSKYTMSFTSALNDGTAKMIIPGQNGTFFILQLDKIDYDSSSLFKLEITNLKDETTETKNLSIFEEISIGQYVCAVRD